MSNSSFRIRVDTPLEQEGVFIICPSEIRFPFMAGGAVALSAMPRMKVGDRVLIDGVETSLRIVSVLWLPQGTREASAKGYMVHGWIKEVGEFDCTCNGPGFSGGYSLAWVTLSDKGAAGKRVDESGPMIRDMVGSKMNLEHGQGFVIPDEEDQLKALLVDLALNQKFDLVFTTGGTGVGPRDISPEATLSVIEKRLPGYERAMTAASLAKTPHGAISRAVAGTLGEALIVNLPGSPKAVAECLEPLLPTLGHTLDKLKGDPADCANLRK